MLIWLPCREKLLCRTCYRTYINVEILVFIDVCEEGIQSRFHFLFRIVRLKNLGFKQKLRDSDLGLSTDCSFSRKRLSCRHFTHRLHLRNCNIAVTEKSHVDLITKRFLMNESLCRSPDGSQQCHIS